MTVDPAYLTEFARGYTAAAIWADLIGPDGERCDDPYEPQDITAESRFTMLADCVDFITAHYDLLLESGQDAEQSGHDFWLTRNHHGAGFRDRGLGEVGDKLTAASYPYGSSYLFIGDDDRIYISN